ncbi:MAG: hypothetical protein KatS3mg082_0909 [Nitrospiraceae bacterium]|nr:MAG: hypothetical protein KatS3mg082_0909 [Nitrospiraceae bacterium]
MAWLCRFDSRTITPHASARTIPASVGADRSPAYHGVAPRHAAHVTATGPTGRPLRTSGRRASVPYREDRRPRSVAPLHAGTVRMPGLRLSLSGPVASDQAESLSPLPERGDHGPAVWDRPVGFPRRDSAQGFVILPGRTHRKDDGIRLASRSPSVSGRILAEAARGGRRTPAVRLGHLARAFVSRSPRHAPS